MAPIPNGTTAIDMKKAKTADHPRNLVSLEVQECSPYFGTELSPRRIIRWQVTATKVPKSAPRNMYTTKLSRNNPQVDAFTTCLTTRLNATSHTAKTKIVPINPRNNTKRFSATARIASFKIAIIGSFFKVLSPMRFYCRSNVMLSGALSRVRSN